MSVHARSLRALAAVTVLALTAFGCSDDDAAKEVTNPNVGCDVVVDDAACDKSLRPFVFMHGPDRPRVMPGGLTRYAAEEGAVVVNSTQNGGF